MFESDDIAWRGAVLSTENARSLYESALQIRTAGQFGCAVALFVLCAEEASKAMAIGRNITNPISEKMLRDLFRRHSLKHDGGAHISTIAHLLIGLIQEAPEEGKPRHGECGVVESIEAWRKTADEQKKLGLYVDFENGKWLTPASVKEKDTEMSEFVAATLLTMAEGYFLKGSLEELYSFRADNDR